MNTYTNARTEDLQEWIDGYDREALNWVRKYALDLPLELQRKARQYFSIKAELVTRK